MYSETDIDGAVAAGALPAEAAAALRAHVAATRAAPAADEESFRLITGFNDVFVTIAILVLLFAIAAGGGGGLVAAAVSWGLAEYFTRRRRMALPSIVLLLSFVGGVASIVLATGLTITAGTTGDNLSLALAGLLGAAAAGAHWWRFRVPITIAAGAVAALAFVLGLLLAYVPGAEAALFPLLLAGGVALFALAMRWDLSDPARTTRRSDVAFWLHLAAAPLIAHATFQLLGVFDGELGTARAVVVLALYVAFGLVALAVDRRALLVSGLGYVLYALGTLLASGSNDGARIPLTAFVIGSALLLLSALWQRARRVVVGWLGPWGARLPPVEVSPRPA